MVSLNESFYRGLSSHGATVRPRFGYGRGMVSGVTGSGAVDVPGTAGGGDGGTWCWVVKVASHDVTVSPPHGFFPDEPEAVALDLDLSEGIRLRPASCSTSASPCSPDGWSSVPGEEKQCHLISFVKIGPWDLCWFKRLRIDLLCFFAIGCNFVDISFMQH